MARYIFITGGVVSSLGKGLASAALGALLQSRGYQVQAFTSGSDLLQTLHSDAPPDVVLLDVSMPGMDGLETLKAIRVAHPHVQVVMLSGGKATATIVDAMRQGAFDYVVKPDDPEGLGEAALEAAIRNAIEKTVLSSEVARLRTQVGQDPEGRPILREHFKAPVADGFDRGNRFRGRDQMIDDLQSFRLSHRSASADRSIRRPGAIHCCT